MVPKEVKCTESHEWVRLESDKATATVGLSHYAMEQLGEIVYLELPEAGAQMAKGDEFGTIESVKTASSLYMPVGGEVLEVNTDVTDKLDLLSAEPYGAAWLIKVKLSDAGELDGLMDATAYEKHIEGEE
ncbi:MAG: glycine cleavage system protein GcvH [Fibrobacteria bacterium]|nr:glycine cleavage system protein GcvH [Fibrobacteria bacterium]